MLGRGRSNTMARRYKGRPDTFRTDLVIVAVNGFTFLKIVDKQNTMRSPAAVHSADDLFFIFFGEEEKWRNLL